MALGPPHVVFVEGDAGVGKTALLEEVVDGAAMPVLRARPTAAEAASSYAALHDLLQPAWPSIAFTAAVAAREGGAS